MESTISSRGLALEGKMPVFFDVLRDLWDPELNPNGIVNLGLAENSLMQEELRDFINSQPRADNHALTYGDGFSGSKRLKEALCHFLNRHFQPHKPLLPSHMCVTSGTSNALENCAWSLCDTGDYVLVGRPYWTTFRSMFGNRAGVNILEVDFGKIDPMGLEAVERFEEVFEQAKQEGKRIRAILLCSPSNPLGTCCSEEVLKGYMRLCQKLGIHLISDEIYGLSIWDNSENKSPTPFKSVLSLDIENFMDPQMVHVVWGMSKDFGATGLRIGALISQSNVKFLNACESISLLNFPSSLADKTVASLLMDDAFTEKFISTNRARLSDSFQRVAQFLQAHGIPYHKSNAGLFAWANLKAAMNQEMTDGEVLDRLRAEKVYLTSGSTYASEEAGWFRIVIAHPRHVLDEGLRRILRAIT